MSVFVMLSAQVTNYQTFIDFMQYMQKLMMTLLSSFLNLDMPFLQTCFDPEIVKYTYLVLHLIINLFKFEIKNFWKNKVFY